MQNRFSSLRNISDFSRDEEEFNMRKDLQAQNMSINKEEHAEKMFNAQFKRDNPGSDNKTPPAIIIDNELKSRLDAGDYDGANRLFQTHRAAAFGVDRFQPPQENRPQEPQGGAPIEQSEFIPTGQPMDLMQSAPRDQESIPQYYKAPERQLSVPEQLARNAGLKARAETQGKEDVLSKMMPPREADKAQRLADIAVETKARELQAKYIQEGKQSLPKLQRALQSQELKEEFLQPKIADLKNRALNIWSATGFTGALAGAIPGTAAADFAKDVGTLLANAGFDRLQEMRDNSVTGGALGAITEKELDLLQAAAQNILNSQSEGQFIKNIEQFQAQRIRGLQNVRAAYAEDYKRFNGAADEFLPSPASMEDNISRSVLAPFELEQEATPPKGGAAEIRFNLKKKGFSAEQITEFLSRKGIK